MPDMGWQSKQNGELLAAMVEEGIGYLLTADKNLRFQQNISKYGVKVVVLLAYDTRRKFLEQFVGEIENRIMNWEGDEDFPGIDLHEKA